MLVNLTCWYVYFSLILEVLQILSQCLGSIVLEFAYFKVFSFSIKNHDLKCLIMSLPKLSYKLTFRWFSSLFPCTKPNDSKLKSIWKRPRSK